MNKNDLIENITKSVNVSRNTATQVLDTFIRSVTESLRKHKDVVLVNFGSFKVSQRSARMGRNPQTGAPIRIPARTVVRFLAGKKLKEALKEGMSID
ncbi:HU family DNA-binding protein [Coxiella endosymbiont of Amblyomma sculptum]|uniref:HU family DNA-binding protein n=1 Tax=Coxiella endosymbiont of Amblyomma sculptum TaxID=2487929 RepID=UPI00132E877F|nr:HU family DNA-binding protein [Coxiella endosymbiont of Amblyomma sculptum]QHG92677.1 HU family DNA-binding protein [Coxiella endosymbiont of Amblyomma sculptum]